MNAPVEKNIALHDLGRLDVAGRARLLRRAESDLTPFLDKVKPIVEAVRTEGDAAIVRLAREIDRVDIDPEHIAARPADFDRAFSQVDRAVIDAIEYAVENIRRFHEEQKPESMWMKEVRPGAFAGDRWLPIPSVACYVPRGKGAFPSVVMMTTVPAVVAGVPEICVVTPPGPGGDFDAATLVAAQIAGVKTVYRVGGAVAVAAVAYGTKSVKQCTKIVGPGSPWVVAAKRLLAGVLDITTTELADELVGGVLSAGPERLTAAARHGVPQVVSVGALDMVNFHARDTVPAKFADRTFYQHNPSVTLMRTTPAENLELGRQVGHKVAMSSGPAAILLPARGVSAIDREGAPFDDPLARRELFAGVRQTAGPIDVLELDCHINDPEFAEAAVQMLIELMQRSLPDRDKL